MAETKVTRKELFARIAEVMANDPEVVEMCGKYIEQLSRPRKKKVNESMIAIGTEVLGHMGAEPMTNKELYTWYNETHAEAVSSQKMAAVMRYLVSENKVEKIVGDKTSDPVRYQLI